jgi:Ca2+/Na+ antiporter
MNGTALFELLAAICALLAAIFIFDQQLNRPRPHKLLWTLGLLFYGLAAGADFLGVVSGWTVGEYKAWYYFGGVLTAAFLGLGSLYLLAPRRVGHIATAIATVIALYAAVRILFFAPFSPADLHTLATAPTSILTNVRAFKPLPGDMEVVAIIMNIPGALLLFGGAAWSAWQFWRKRAGAYRLASMLLLALGAVFPSILTGLQALGNTSGAAVGEFLGAICLLAGLLISLDVFTVFRVPFTHIVLYERTSQPVSKAGAAPQR